MEKERIVAVSYCRVSKEDQLKNDGPTIKLSLENQRQRAEEVAAEHGWEYLKDYREEGITGEELEIRPQLLKLLKDARAGLFNLVIMRHTNRIGRRQFIYHYVTHTLEVECKIQILNLDNPQPVVPPSQFFPSRDNGRVYRRGIEGMLAESESNSRVMLLEVGRRNQVMKGRYIGSRRPFGYKIEEIINSGKVERIPVPDPKEYWVLEAMVKWYLEEGLSAGEITVRLTESKISSVTGKPWKLNVILQMLGNPFYAGKLSYGVEKNHLGMPAIFADHNYARPWTWEQFEAIQRRRQELRIYGPRTLGKNDNPLSGLVYCGNCKHKMYYGYETLNPKKKPRTLPKTAYVRCSLHKNNHAGCPLTNRVPLDKLLKLLWPQIDRLVKEITEEPDAFMQKMRSEGLAELKKDLSIKRKGIETELERFEKQLNNLDLALLNGLPVADFERLRSLLDSQRNEAENALAHLERNELEIAGKEVKLNDLINFANQWQQLRGKLETRVELWDQDFLREVKVRLRQIIKRIEVVGTYTFATLHWEFDVKITWGFLD